MLLVQRAGTASTGQPLLKTAGTCGSVPKLGELPFKYRQPRQVQASGSNAYFCSMQREQRPNRLEYSSYGELSLCFLSKPSPTF